MGGRKGRRKVRIRKKKEAKRQKRKEQKRKEEGKENKKKYICQVGHTALLPLTNSLENGEVKKINAFGQLLPYTKTKY